MQGACDSPKMQATMIYKSQALGFLHFILTAHLHPQIAGNFPNVKHSDVLIKCYKCILLCSLSYW